MQRREWRDEGTLEAAAADVAVSDVEAGPALAGGQRAPADAVAARHGAARRRRIHAVRAEHGVLADAGVRDGVADVTGRDRRAELARRAELLATRDRRARA